MATSKAKTIVVPEGMAWLGVPDSYRDLVAKHLFAVAINSNQLNSTLDTPIDIEQFRAYVSSLESERVQIRQFRIMVAPVSIQMFCDFFQKISGILDLCTGSSPEGYQNVLLESENRLDPILGVTWWEANLFCQFLGGRLPTEGELYRILRSENNAEDIHLELNGTSLLELSPSWCGCEFLGGGHGEWTCTPARYERRERWGAPHDVVVFGSSDEIAFPFIQNETANAMYVVSEVNCVEGARYEGIGFRCAFDLW